MSTGSERDILSLPNGRELTFRHYARSIISRHIQNLKDDGQHPSPMSVIYDPSGTGKKQDVVGILGAGVGGLYTALMLQSLDIPFEIIEGSNRIGGRLYTYKFEHEKAGKYDYYDLGAMRYPMPPRGHDGKYKSGISQRLGNLFDFLGMQDKLIPYYFSSDPNHDPPFKLFNNVRARADAQSDWNASALGIGSDVIKVGVDGILEDIVSPFTRRLLMDTQEGKDGKGEGWKVMMRNDVYSTRAYMSLKYIPSAKFELVPEHLTTNVVNWLETMDTSTGSYDSAFTETVLEAIAFGSAHGETIEWKCIDGGSSVLPETMAKRIKDNLGRDPIIINAPVTSISLENENREDSPIVVVAGGLSRSYAHVISTLPLPVLRTIDMTKCKLDLIQENALRQLQYGPSIKIGILFTENWWSFGKDKDGVPFNIVGGQSSTDLPIRTIVYPSHGANTDEPSKTLMASYCWTSDAERLGTWFQSGDQTNNKKLRDLVLKNLAAVHNVTYEFLDSRLLSMHAWDWNDYEFTMGAFADFGPGNFEYLYTSLTRPAANGRLHFAGEALSIRHAWVVGALDSAWRAVHNYLYLTDRDKIPLLVKLWGTSREWLPREFDEFPEPDEDSPVFGNEGVKKFMSGSILEKYIRCTRKGY